MESRGQLAKRLVRLTADGVVNAGEAISANGKEVGTITSAAAAAGGTLALGYVKSSALMDNTPLYAGDQPLGIIMEQPGV
jgi:folate-binding Fe-S cluster repair protein YgfZ